MEDIRIKYRPGSFSEVWGNREIKALVNGWTKRASNPKSIVLVGPYGCGKTTLAKLIAKRLLCLGKGRKDCLERCGECSVCLNSETYFREIDSPNTTVDDARRYILGARHLFNEGRCGIYFDEIQRWNLKNQEIFLKPIEEGNYFFIFSTTDLVGIDEGILSRSDVFAVEKPSSVEMLDGLIKICNYNDINIDKEVLVKLISICQRTPRKCLTVLDMCRESSKGHQN